MAQHDALAVFVTSAGRRVGLSNCFRDAGERLGLPVRILAGDRRPELSAACALADKAVQLPPVHDPGYAQAVLEIAVQQGAALVVPTIDTELPAFAAAAEAFRSAGVGINISSVQAVAIARDTERTAAALSAGGIRVPATQSLEVFAEPTTRALSLPVLAKPKGGSSSVGIVRAETLEALAPVLGRADYIVQELLSGPEYTVNCFVDASGTCVAAVPHRRIEVRAGEVSKGVTERHAALTAIARQIVAAVPGLRGVYCFQAIDTGSGPAVFEINARFGGGYPLAHRAGARFAQWLLEEVRGRPITADDRWEEGWTMLRYDSEVFSCR